MSLLSVVWHKRIAVRLALLIATALLLFAWSAPYLRQAAEFAIGLPSEDTHLGILHTGWIREELLAGGTEPTPQCVADLDEVLASKHVAFLWLSPKGVVVAGSKSLPWHGGNTWPHALETMQRIELNGLDVPVTLTRVFEGDVELGKMVTIALDESGHRQWHLDHGATDADIAGCVLCNIEESLLVDEYEYEQSIARREQIAVTSTITIAVVVALLIGCATSWLVTRRLRRIARQIAMSEQSGEVPGPFEERRFDEIGALAHAMNRLRADLQSRDQERRDWIAQVSHDLRTPLTALIACLDRVKLSVTEDPAGASLVRTALRDAERVQSLSEDLLEIAKLDAHICGVEEPVPAGELVRRVTEDLEPWAGSGGLQLVAVVEPDMPLVMADGNRLLRALENMIRNGLQHAAKVVQVAVRSKRSHIEFEVTDDGPGFASDCKLAGMSLAIGIGLVVVRRVAEAHRGNFGAENLPGGGARVWFEIPVDEAGAVAD